jgi:hypothetical protein
MSDLLEVISISSGDTSTQVTPAVILSLVSNALFHSPASFEHCIDANELNAWLSECPPNQIQADQEELGGYLKVQVPPMQLWKSSSRKHCFHRIMMSL